MGLVLVGDSGGEQGRDAAALASLLAQLVGADVVRIRVVHDTGVEADDHASAAEAGELEVHVGRSPARVLYELAASREATMLVLGSSHRAGPGRVLPGGVGARLLQGGPCPIAVAPLHYAKHGRGEPRVIGVAFDDSPEAHCALALAADLGTAARAALRVISAYPGSPPPKNPILQEPSPYELMQGALSEAVRPLPASLRAEPRFRTGQPADVLVGETELGIDLLVMGSRGYGPLRSVLLGSISEAVMQRAACPVLIVPRESDSGRLSLGRGRLPPGGERRGTRGSANL